MSFHFTGGGFDSPPDAGPTFQRWQLSQVRINPTLDPDSFRFTPPPGSHPAPPPADKQDGKP
jgi:hypothetical protein